MEEFTKYYLEAGSAILHKELTNLMVRRTYNDEVLRRPIIALPETSYATVAIKPKRTEITLYQWLEAYFKKKIDAVRNAGNLSENEKRTIVLAMIQRLRQMVAHWFVVVDLLGQGEKNLVVELIKEFGPDLSDKTVMLMINYIFKLASKTEKFSQKRKNVEVEERTRVKNDECKWQEIGRELPTALRKKIFRQEKKPKFTIKEWYKASGPLLNSSKTEVVISEIGKRLKKDSTRKIVVFTQSTEMIYILSELCEQKGWICVQYHGHMSQKARIRVLDIFEKDPSVQIFIMSLLTGREGLNLTVTSCVINMDL